MLESNAYKSKKRRLRDMFTHSRVRIMRKTWKNLIGENLFLLLESIYIGYLYPYRRRASVMLLQGGPQWCLFWTK